MTVLPWSADSLGTQKYDLAIGCCGYESRARFVIEKMTVTPITRLCFKFSGNAVLDFNKNQQFYSERNYTFIPPTYAGAEKGITEELTKLNLLDANGTRVLHVLVDISSMTRLLIAATVVTIARVSKATNKSIITHFAYATAAFGEIPRIDGPIVADGPAIPLLAGWPNTPAAPLGLIIGIGYEEDLALGVIEELEAANVWAFRPQDHDPLYEDAIIEKNKGLFEQIPPNNTVRYPLFSPYALFSSLETLVGLGKNKSRLIVVPLGPKIFALASCLAAVMHYPAVGYWRVSSGENMQPVDRRANGNVIGLSVQFKATTWSGR